MIPALTTAIITTGVLLMLGIGILAWSDGDAIRGNEVRLTTPLADERTDLAEPWPVRQTPTDLAAAYQDPPPYPWTSLPLEPGLLDRVHLYAGLGVYPRIVPTIGERARLHGAADTQEFVRAEFARIVGVELVQLGTGSHRERRAAA